MWILITPCGPNLSELKIFALVNSWTVFSRGLCTAPGKRKKRDEETDFKQIFLGNQEANMLVKFKKNQKTKKISQKTNPWLSEASVRIISVGIRKAKTKGEVERDKWEELTMVMNGIVMARQKS